MISCVDLFAGCGGMSRGFENAGFHVLAAFDNWEKSIKVYKENFKHPIFEQDLTDEYTSIEKISEVKADLIMGGPPCQDFSSAGKRNVNGGRADLTYNFANIVCSVRPKWFVMENVEQIKKSHILSDIVNQFIVEGYGLSAFILNASYCNVPQTRTRFFMIGHHGDTHNKLNELIRVNLSKKPMTVKDHFGDSLKLKYYYRHPRNYNRRGIYSIDEPSPTVRGVNRPVPAGYKRNMCDPRGVLLKTIRPLTTKERSLIQTFPKRFKFNGSKTHLEQMIGNAVPVKLAEYVAQAIKKYISLETTKNSSTKTTKLNNNDLSTTFKLPVRALSRS